MGWLPANAWTSQQPVHGYRHFERITNGGRGPARWVELAAVLNPQHRERVLWSDLKDPAQWVSGWQPIVEAEDPISPPTAGLLETP